jgi:hypothetical protein
MGNDFSEFMISGSENVKRALKNPENRKWIIENASEGRRFVLQSEWLVTFNTKVFNFSLDGFNVSQDQIAEHTTQILIGKNKKLFYDLIDCDLPNTEKTVQLVAIEAGRQVRCSYIIEQFDLNSKKDIKLSSEAASAIISILFYKYIFLNEARNPERSSLAFDYYDAVLEYYKSLPVFIEIEKLL